MVLLQHGANRDAQDSRDQTPLFLAAREGSYEAAKLLLSHFANRDMTDHMDRLPRDIAQERMHTDIVQLLEEYHADSPTVALANGFASSPDVLSTYINRLPPTKNKGRKRTPKHATYMLAGSHGATAGSQPMKDLGNLPTMGAECKGQIVRLPPATHKAKSKKKKTCESSSLSSGSTIPSSSPCLENLESPDANLDYPPSYESACQGSHSMMADLGAGIHTVGPGMESLSHGSLGLFPAGGVLHGDPGGRQLTEAELSASINELPQDWLSDLTHSQIVNQPNPEDALLHASQDLLPSNSSPLSSSGSPGQNVQASPGVPSQSPGGQVAPTGASPLSQPSSSPLYPNSVSPASQRSVVSPLRKNLPLSPTHMQALQQASRCQGQPSASPPSSYPPSCLHDNGLSHAGHYPQMAPATQMNLIPGHQYPTPPSQHSHLGSDSAAGRELSLIPDHYLTPSPDSPGCSPGQWSSSSPHSAQSDWSEGISSPPQVAHHLAPPPALQGKAGGTKEGAVYI